jgi:F-type H+-transporting ATPase subunit gamma
MTERLADIGARIGGIRQLGAVVNAMRGIAAARAQQARLQVAAVDAYAATIAAAVGQVLPLTAPAVPSHQRDPSHPALVLFCAEQGFAGAFSERVLDAAGPDIGAAEVFIVGTRGVMVAAERSVAIGWNVALPSHSAGIPRLADRIAEALYGRIATGAIDRLDAVFTEWRPGHGAAIRHRRLFPFDLDAFPRPAHANPPLLNLEPEALVLALTAEYMRAMLCEAALNAFAAENEARMEAMTAAHSHVERQLVILSGEQRRVRQEEITAEVIELAAGEAATASGDQGPRH